MRGIVGRVCSMKSPSAEVRHLKFRWYGATEWCGLDLRLWQYIGCDVSTVWDNGMWQLCSDCLYHILIVILTAHLLFDQRERYIYMYNIRGPSYITNKQSIILNNEHCLLRDDSYCIIHALAHTPTNTNTLYTICCVWCRTRLYHASMLAYT